MKKVKHFLSISDLSAKEIWQILLLAKKLKSKSDKNNLLKGKSVVMIFEKPSLRTKLSFDVAINQLGGHPIYFGQQEVGLGKREAVSDIAKVVSSTSDLVVARVYGHDDLLEFSKYSKVPVVNALSDLEHPCQAMTDLFTILEIKKNLKGLTLAFVGDGENNVPHSLVLGCTMLGVNFNCASPKGYFMNKKIVEKAKEYAEKSGANILETEDPEVAVKNADIVYTDTWVSMGDESEEKKRLNAFKKYQVNKKLMSLAKKDAIFMHDLPAYRGNEVSKEVIDGPLSVVFQQAENRLHVQKALIHFMFSKSN